MQVTAHMSVAGGGQAAALALRAASATAAAAGRSVQVPLAVTFQAAALG